MPVRATTLQQAEKFGQCLQAFDVFGAMTWMPHLDAIESGRDETLESLAPPTLAGMCPDREPTGFVRDADRFLDRESRPGYERCRSAAEVSHERVAEILNEAPRYERTGDVGSANRATVRLLQYLVQGDGNLECIELLDDQLGAHVALRAEVTEPRFQGLQVREVQRQQMDFMIVLKGAQLGTGNDPHSETLACRARRGNTIDRVVVSERDRAESAFLGGFDYSLRRERTIRCS